MKALLRIFRLPRRMAVIVGAVLLLGGATGASALFFVAKDDVKGEGDGPVNGLECTAVTTLKIAKKDRIWIRKFIKTDSTDGETRVRTALRVARAVYEDMKPDLVQVVVLDKNGPEQRADMRGRAVGADVIYVADPSKIPDGAVTSPYTAKYVDASANALGYFYGEKVQVPVDEIDRLLASLTDRSDCLDPGAAEGEHKAKKDGEHGGEAKAEPGHEAPAAEEGGHDKPQDGHSAPPASQEGHAPKPVAEIEGGESPVAMADPHATEPGQEVLPAEEQNDYAARTHETAEVKTVPVADE